MDPTPNDKASSTSRECIYDIIVTPSEEFREGSPFPKRPRVKTSSTDSIQIGNDAQEQDAVEIEQIPGGTRNAQTSNNNDFTKSRTVQLVYQMEAGCSKNSKLLNKPNSLQFERRTSRSPLYLPNVNNVNVSKPRTYHSADFVNRNAGDDADNGNNNTGKIGEDKKIESLPFKSDTKCQKPIAEEKPDHRPSILPAEGMQNKLLQADTVLCTTSSSDSWEAITDSGSDSDTSSEKQEPESNNLNVEQHQEEDSAASAAGTGNESSSESEPGGSDTNEHPTHEQQQSSSSNLEFLFLNQNISIGETFEDQDLTQSIAYLLSSTDSIANQLEFELNSNYEPFAHVRGVDHDLDLDGDGVDSRPSCYITEWTEEDEERERQKEKEKAITDIDALASSTDSSRPEDRAVESKPEEPIKKDDGSYEIDGCADDSKTSNEELKNANVIQKHDHPLNDDNNANYRIAASSSKFRGFISAINKKWTKITNGANLLRKQSSEGVLRLKNFVNQKLTRSKVTPSTTFHVPSSSRCIQTGWSNSNVGSNGRRLRRRYVKIPITRFDRVPVQLNGRKRAALVRQIFIRKNDPVTERMASSVDTIIEEDSKPFEKKTYTKQLVTLENFTGPNNSSQNVRKRGGEVRTMLVRVM